MKKILPILLGVIFVLPFGNVFAASKSIIHDYEDEFYDKTIYPELFDGDKDNFIRYQTGKYPLIKFKKPVDIGRLYILYRETGAFNQRLNVDVKTKNETKNIVLNFGKGIIEKYIDVNLIGVESIEFIQNPAGTHFEFYEVDFFTFDEIEYLNVINLNAKHTHDTVDLTWEYVNEDNLSGVLIKQNDVEIAELVSKEKKYTVTGLAPGSNYRYEVYAVYTDGGLSDPVSINVTTDTLPVPAGDVTDLTATATHERVDLSWALPDSDQLKHVNIYREQRNKTFLDRLLGVSSVSASGQKIFETNGTFFNDLTVQPDTKYEYTLTTITTDKVESDGVSVDVTTLSAPTTPEIEGGGHEVDPETGDYTYFWSEPTKGTVKVMVGGKLYATVPAADGQIVIPSADMKYTFLGQPDVNLIPVDEEGNEGKPVNPPSGGGDGSGGMGGVNLPFGVSDLVKTTFEFIRLLGPYILLILAIWLSPKIVKVIKDVIAKQRQQARRSDG